LKEEKDKYPNGKFITKKNKGLIHLLAQKDYDKKVLLWAKKSLKKLDGFINVYGDNKCADIYEKLGKARQDYINAYQLPIDIFAAQWINTSYLGKAIYPETTTFVTDKGEKVRSKSEKILADKFYNMNIPYKYEAPIQLKGYGTVYPDFTLLNVRTREIYYWEHLGMMDNQEYIQKTFVKINTFVINGIFPGKKLLLSYEIKNNLNMEVAEKLIGEYLL
jgi:hypothetical protein